MDFIYYPRLSAAKITYRLLRNILYKLLMRFHRLSQR